MIFTGTETFSVSLHWFKSTMYYELADGKTISIWQSTKSKRFQKQGWTFCSLHVARYFFLVARCFFLVARYFLLVAIVTLCSLLVTFCSLLGTCSLLITFSSKLLWNKPNYYEPQKNGLTITKFRHKYFPCKYLRFW